jgi:hypothetical protein
MENPPAIRLVAANDAGFNAFVLMQPSIVVVETDNFTFPQRFGMESIALT